MFYSNKNKRAICIYTFFCFFTMQVSFSQNGFPPPPVPGEDVQDVALPINKWQGLVIIPTILMGIIFIYKKIPSSGT